MTLDGLVNNAQIFFLIFARVIMIVEIAPLFSSGGIPQLAKIGLALLTSTLLLPGMIGTYSPVPQTVLEYVLLLTGEALVGVVIAFFLVVIFAAFQVAGEFFSLPMGFGASEVFDPMAQVEIPLMGQYFNTAAMFVFLSVGGFQKIFLTGIAGSFHSVRAIDFAVYHADIASLLISSLSHLFEQAFIISLPILGTLFLVQITLGLLAKAAPQLNLLMLGFPISITVAFLVILFTLPVIMGFFGKVIDASFLQLQSIYDHIQAAKGGGG